VVEWKKLKAKSTDYEEGGIKTCGLFSYWSREEGDLLTDFNRTILDVGSMAKGEDVHLCDMTLMYKDNRKELRKRFGACSFTFRGFEFYYCYLLKLKSDRGSAEIIVLTSKDKGTCFEVVEERNGDPVKCCQHVVIDFINEYLEWSREFNKEEK
jgi:hypothetical protein